MKKGFTLIELLAVIVILAIIAAITIPIVITSITNARKSTFETDAKSLMLAAENYYSASYLSENIKLPITVTYENQKEITTYNGTEIGTGLDYTGKNPDSGNIKISAKGEIEINVYNKNLRICAIKNKKDKTVKIKEMKEDECLKALS